MNRLHGGKRTKWTRFKKWSAMVAGAVVAVLFAVVIVNIPPVRAATTVSATPAWLNHYYMTADGKTFKDENPFDDNFQYVEQTTDTCKSFIVFYYQNPLQGGRPANRSAFTVNTQFFYNDTTYADRSWFRPFYVTLKHVTNSAGQDTCVSTLSGKSDNAGSLVEPTNSADRKITFYKDSTNKIRSIGSQITFSQVVKDDVALGRYPRYFRDNERTDRNNSCPDMIVLHPANVMQDGDSLFGATGDIPGSSLLFSVEASSDLSRHSETYALDSGLVNIDKGTCRVRGSAVDKQMTGEFSQYSSGNSGDDTFFLSAGLDENGNTSRGPNDDYEDDAFVIFIGDESNMPKDASGAVITEPADSSQNAGNPDKTDLTVCRGEGLGWIICPIISAIQKASDLLRDAMQYFLTVNPLPVGTGPIYTSWNNIRNFANIAFVIAFFAIIFSQATSVGISNYGIKRLLPRLILVVVATNTSYFLCSFLIDVFNILGVGVTNLIAVVNGGAAGTIDVSAGAGAVFTGGVGVAIAWAFGTGAIVEIFPLIIAAMLALLVTFIILVARQALIVLLVVFSPLAFVAGLLPGTQQFLTRWSNLFVGMLVMYPLVMGLFAAGRLASSILSAAGN